MLQTMLKNCALYQFSFNQSIEVNFPFMKKKSVIDTLKVCFFKQLTQSFSHSGNNTIFH